MGKGPGRSSQRQTHPGSRSPELGYHTRAPVGVTLQTWAGRRGDIKQWGLPGCSETHPQPELLTRLISPRPADRSPVLTGVRTSTELEASQQGAGQRSPVTQSAPSETLQGSPPLRHPLPVPLAITRSPWRESTHSLCLDSFPTSHPTNSYSSLKAQLHHLLCEASLTSPRQFTRETTEAQ